MAGKPPEHRYLPVMSSQLRGCEKGEGLGFLKSLGLLAWHDRVKRQGRSEVDPLVILVHGNRFPRTILHTESAADTPIQIDFDDF
jgi:hypothetical protein